ncbi:uncharacterized protein LOC122374721 [Amphibalanus amphitrite]|uniref:uncharacterized protein LOC122374721 n=2 Tax=Amphibalanus amphitrite TaxID=1232801 RepID=UPI001C903EF1|nr:uncharacterized protein LOC122374721 [Amphibalanus amphitrite]
MGRETHHREGKRIATSKMKCVVLLLAVVSCASAYVILNPYSYYSGVSPYIWRKKRSAPEAPAEDQQADPALFYKRYVGYPYSSYIHYLKKREAPAEDQQADPALFYKSYVGYPYSSYVHYLKKREAPAEDQQADAAMFYRSYRYPAFGYTYPGVRILKKRAADPEKEEEDEKKKVVYINAMPYSSLGYPFYSYAPYIYKK